MVPMDGAVTHRYYVSGSLSGFLHAGIVSLAVLWAPVLGPPMVEQPPIEVSLIEEVIAPSDSARAVAPSPVPEMREVTAPPISTSVPSLKPEPEAPVQEQSEVFMPRMVDPAPVHQAEVQPVLLPEQDEVLMPQMVARHVEAVPTSQTEFQSALLPVGDLTEYDIPEPRAPAGPADNSSPETPSREVLPRRILQDPILQTRPAMGGRVRLAHSPRPVYPQLARASGWEGTVHMRVVVSPTGLPSMVEVKKSSGYEVLDNAALKAVKDWRFSPARDGAFAVRSELELAVQFRLAQGG